MTRHRQIFRRLIAFKLAVQPVRPGFILVAVADEGFVLEVAQMLRAFCLLFFDLNTSPRECLFHSPAKVWWTFWDYFSDVGFVPISAIG